MVTAKIGGITRPCTARQKMSSERLVASPAIKVGTTSTNIAATITRFLPEHIGNRAGERRGQRDRQGTDRDDGGNFGGAGAEFGRQQRQDGLRGVKIDEAAKAGEKHRKLPRGKISACGSGIHRESDWARDSAPRSYASVLAFRPEAGVVGQRGFGCMAWAAWLDAVQVY